MNRTNEDAPGSPAGATTMWNREITRRDLLVASTAAGAALALAACGPATQASPSASAIPATPGASAIPATPGASAQAGIQPTTNLGSIQATNGHVSLNGMRDGAFEVARQFNLPHAAEYVYDFNNEKFLALLDQGATAGVDCISTLIQDNGFTRQIAEACVRNKIYLSTYAQVGLWIMPCEPELDFHYQGLANPPDGAYLTCKNMFTQLGGVGNFVHLTGLPGSATSLAKDNAIDRAVAEFPGIKMIAREYGEFNREKSRTILDAILTANDNKVDAVFGQSDDSSIGAIAALRERGLIGKTLVGGADGIPEMIDAIIAGEAFGTEGIVPFFGGGYAAVQAIDAYNGHKPDPIEGLMQMDFVMVDSPESAQLYKDAVYGPSGGPRIFDYKKMSRVLHPDDWDPQWPIRTADPETFWAKNQGVEKPGGYELPESYTKAVADGGYDRVNKLYRERLKNWPLLDAARKSTSGKSLFEQLYGDNLG